MSMAGQPILGNTLQEGGVKLQLTLINAKTEDTLSDADNPRRDQGLFSGVAGRPFDPTVILTDNSSHTFECKVLLLSSDIDGALMKLKVSRLNADAGDPLCFVTRAFMSRSRSNIHEVGNKRPRLLPNDSDIDPDLSLNDVSDPTPDIDPDLNLNGLSNLTPDIDPDLLPQRPLEPHFAGATAKG